MPYVRLAWRVVWHVADTYCQTEHLANTTGVPAGEVLSPFCPHLEAEHALAIKEPPSVSIVKLPLQPWENSGCVHVKKLLAHLLRGSRWGNIRVSEASFGTEG